MTASIQILPLDLASQIAAGEVVERPSSIVKELIENALDAGARRIKVAISQGGLSELTVVDDGHGMRASDAPLCLYRHATSKLRAIADLEELPSYGFRGEALPSISSVSRLTITTRTSESDAATTLVAEGTTEPKVALAGAPVGTTVEVRDLFFNVPARRKFLKSSNTESGHVTDVVAAAALTRPEVSFELYRDGRRVRHFPAAVDRAERVTQVLEGEDLLHCAGTRGPLCVEAFLSRPERARQGALGLKLVVNGRNVRDRALSATVAHAYGSVLERGRYPRGVLFLDLPARLLDVNVHPQKTEVRFAEARPALDAVYGIIARALTPALSATPAGATGPETSRGAQPLDSQRNSLAAPHKSPPSTSLGWSDATPSEHAPTTTPLSFPYGSRAPEPRVLRDRSPPVSGVRYEADALSRRTDDGPRASTDQGQTFPSPPQTEFLDTSSQPPGGSYPGEAGLTEPSPPPGSEAFTGPPLAALLAAATSGASTFSPENPPFVPGQGEQLGFSTVPSTRERAETTASSWKNLRFLNQLRHTFLLCEGNDGLYILDQHAAAERVIFSKLSRSYQVRDIPTQALLFPVIVDITPKEGEVLESRRSDIAHLGLDVRVRTPEQASVHGIPKLLAKHSPERLLRDLLRELARSTDRAYSAAVDKVLATMACHSAVRAGDVLSAVEAQALLRQLDAADFSGDCPHGRPIVAFTSWLELERKVGRR